jgi:hypothetical protein
MSDHQLPPRERGVLEALERAIGEDDPEFVERFTVEAQKLSELRSRSWQFHLPRWFRRRGDRGGEL